MTKALTVFNCYLEFASWYLVTKQLLLKQYKVHL